MCEEFRMFQVGGGLVFEDVARTWCDRVIEMGEEFIVEEEHENSLLSDSVKHRLKYIQKHLIISPLDKAASNYVFTCNRLYASCIRAELTKENGAYKKSRVALDSILSLHKKTLSVWGLWDEKMGKLGYLYEIPKFHKNPVGHRFIAGCSAVTTTKLARLLVKVLGFILKVLREKDDVLIEEKGVRRYFVIDNFEELVNFLSKWGFHKFESVRSGDFSTLYTTIPLNDLTVVLKRVILEAWDYMCGVKGVERKKLFISVNKKKVEWDVTAKRVVHSRGLHVLSFDRVFTMLLFLINNTYLRNGSVIYQQVVGIPMGTNPGPVLANMYLYGYESAYIDRNFLDVRPEESEIVRMNRLESGRAFHMTFRYIDDTLSFDNPLWVEGTAKPLQDGGVYPEWLTFNDTSLVRSHFTSANFLGINISISGKGQIACDVHDKRKDFPFPVQRYPDMSSFIPKTMVYSVFLTLLDRFYKICSRPSSFLYHVLELSKTMMGKGCVLNKLIGLFVRFFRKKGRGSQIRWGNGMTFKKLLHKFRTFVLQLN
jgi:hypothetical protein